TREDLRGDRLELLPLLAGLADRAQEEVAAAGVAERRELLDALGGGADDPVLPCEGLEVLGVTPGEDADPRLLGALVIAPHGDAEGPAREHVARRGHLGRDRRRAEREQVLRDAELEPARDRRVGGEQRERLVERGVEGDVVARPDRVEAELLDLSHERELLLGGLHGEGDAEAGLRLTSGTRLSRRRPR